MRAKPIRPEEPIALPETLEQVAYDPEGHRARVAELAERHGLDFATAYSVIAGVVTLEDALRCRDREPEEDEHGLAIYGDDEPRRVLYDRAFVPAVEDGHLSIQEAVERGRRTVFAAILAKRYRLPLSLAILVTDKRLRLPEAIDLADRRDMLRAGSRPLPGRRLSNAQRGVVLLLAGAVAAGLAIRAVAQWHAAVDHGRALERTASARPAAPPRAAPTRAAPSARVAPELDVRRDADGRVIRIVATTPEAVLGALCAASGVRCEVVGPMPATAPYWDRRLGLVRFAEPTGIRAVTLVRDGATRRWVTGDGHTPLRVIAPPPSVADLGP